MKQLLANQVVTTTASAVLPADPKLGDIQTSTLGLLVRQFFETFVVVAGAADGASRVAPHAEQPLTEVVVRTTVCLEMNPADYELARKSVADLVELRNTLTHHFIELFDLWSEVGCESAFAYLTASCERIGEDLEELQNWAKSMNEARRKWAEILRSDAAQDYFVDGIGLDGIVDWERAGIVTCLRETATASAIDGWTALAAAIAFIQAAHPEQTPQKYGCRSWPHAIDSSKCFDLKYTSEPGAAKVALYRLRRRQETGS